MTRRQITTAILTILLIPFLRAVPALAIGDKVIPHVVNGADSGLGYRTKIDITNLSYFSNTTITKVTVYFYKDDGTAWTLGIKDPATGNLQNVSSVILNLGTLQTLRIETSGTGAFGSGFAIIRNLEATTYLPDDYETAITVFFEVLQSGNIIDTVSVPVGRPTVSFAFPVEIDKTVNPTLRTGFAIANLVDVANRVDIDLYENMVPQSGNAQKYPQSASITLSSPPVTKKTARFLDEAQFFPNITKFKGVAVGVAQYPVALLTLLQTPTTTGGVQYATLVPAYLDSLRRNTLMYLPQGYALDADIPVVDYFRDETAVQDDVGKYAEIPWDVLFETVSTTVRQLTPQAGTTVAVIGQQNVDQFDAITIETLRGLSYGTTSIDLRDGSANLQEGFTFAVKTGLGQYAKVRVRTVITFSASTNKDIVLEIYVYK
jgi:hypothetical protein